MGLSLVVLAAGIGSRYGGLKQLERVGPGGATLAEYAAFDAQRVGFDRVILVVKPGMETAVREAFGDRIARRLPVVCAAQGQALPAPFVPPAGRTKPWGTGHAALAAAEHLDGPFAVVNNELIYLIKYSSLAYMVTCIDLTGPKSWHRCFLNIWRCFSSSARSIWHWSRSPAGG